MAFLTKDDTPVIWRGPMLHGVVQQFFREVAWDEVDYLIVDLPPGTGDVALSLSQSMPVAGAVLVTTPQAVSLADTRRAVKMYEKLNVPPIGLIENMSHFICPTCRTESDIFGKGGGEALARETNVPFLGRIPIYEPIRIGGDTGVPIVVGEPTSRGGRVASARWPKSSPRSSPSSRSSRSRRRSRSRRFVNPVLNRNRMRSDGWPPPPSHRRGSAARGRHLVCPSPLVDPR